MVLGLVIVARRLPALDLRPLRHGAAQRWHRLPIGIDPDIARELPRAFRMIVRLSRQHIPELPALGHGVQASGDHIEVAWAIVARARVALRGARALKVEPDRPIGRPLSQDVLAFDPQRAAAFKAKLDVGRAFLV